MSGICGLKVEGRDLRCQAQMVADMFRARVEQELEEFFSKPSFFGWFLYHKVGPYQL